MSEYIICIPSYKRANVCNEKTLQALKLHNINPKIIYLYLADKLDYDIYQEILDKNKYNK